MNTMRDDTPHGPHGGPGSGQGGHGGHGWMVIACCIPMLVIAVTLVATGVVGSGFILSAVACAAMMALMMGAMNHGGRSQRRGQPDDHREPEDTVPHQRHDAHGPAPWGRT
jgi:hypothetical protein